MIFDTENIDAQSLQMLFEEISKSEFLKTKQQYSNPVYYRKNISRKGVDKRLSSIFSPQTYLFCGMVFISDKPTDGYIEPIIEKVDKLVLKKFIKPF